MYLEVAQILKENIPNINTYGEIQPPSDMAIFISQILTFIFISCIIIMISGDFLLNKLGAVGHTIKQFNINYPFGLVLIGFIANQIASKLTSTGAFEVYVNDIQVWSKIQTGYLPDRDQLIDLIKQTINKIK